MAAVVGVVTNNTATEATLWPINREQATPSGIACSLFDLF
jgi:hypothetical protein